MPSSNGDRLGEDTMLAIEVSLGMKGEKSREKWGRHITKFNNKLLKFVKE